MNNKNLGPNTILLSQKEQKKQRHFLAKKHLLHLFLQWKVEEEENVRVMDLEELIASSQAVLQVTRSSNYQLNG